MRDAVTLGWAVLCCGRAWDLIGAVSRRPLRIPRIARLDLRAAFVTDVEFPGIEQPVLSYRRVAHPR